MCNILLSAYYMAQTVLSALIVLIAFLDKGPQRTVTIIISFLQEDTRQSENENPVSSLQSHVLDNYTIL